MTAREKLRCAVEALRTIWRGDAALVRVPLDPAERKPMCTTLADCVRCQHDREQLAAHIAALPDR